MDDAIVDFAVNNIKQSLKNMQHAVDSYYDNFILAMPDWKTTNLEQAWELYRKIPDAALKFIAVCDEAYYGIEEDSGFSSYEDMFSYLIKHEWLHVPKSKIISKSYVIAALNALYLDIEDKAVKHPIEKHVLNSGGLAYFLVPLDWNNFNTWRVWLIENRFGQTKL